MNRSLPLAGAAGLALLLAAGAARADGLTLAHALSVNADARQVPLKDPEGVACAESGQITVADTGNGRLLRFAWSGSELTGGTELKLPELPYPVRLEVDGAGGLLALDRVAHRLVRVDAAGAFAGFLEVRGPGGAPAMVGAFKLDRGGAVHLVDQAGRAVLTVDRSGAVGRSLPLPEGAAAVTDLAVDPAGTIYLVDAAAAVVWVADRSAAAFKPLTTGLREQLSFPAAITVSRGRLVLVDQNGAGLVLLGLDGTYQGRLLTRGHANGQLSYPAQICFTDKGDLFVADRSNERLQVFKAAR